MVAKILKLCEYPRVSAQENAGSAKSPHTSSSAIQGSPQGSHHFMQYKVHAVFDLET